MQLPIEKVITQFRVRYLGLFYLSREKKILYIKILLKLQYKKNYRFFVKKIIFVFVGHEK